MTSWIGFGIAAFVFVVIWIFNIVFMYRMWLNSASTFEHACAMNVGVYVLLGIFNSVLLLTALICSITGLVTASRNGQRKWPSACGLGLCLVGFYSMFVPLISYGG